MRRRTNAKEQDPPTYDRQKIKNGAWHQLAGPRAHAANPEQLCHLKSGVGPPISLKSGVGPPISLKSGVGPPISLKSGVGPPVSLKSGVGPPVRLRDPALVEMLVVAPNGSAKTNIVHTAVKIRSELRILFISTHSLSRA